MIIIFLVAYIILLLCVIYLILKLQYTFNKLDNLITCNADYRAMLLETKSNFNKALFKVDCTMSDIKVSLPVKKAPALRHVYVKPKVVKKVKK